MRWIWQTRQRRRLQSNSVHSGVDVMKPVLAFTSGTHSIIHSLTCDHVNTPVLALILETQLSVTRTTTSRNLPSFVHPAYFPRGYSLLNILRLMFLVSDVMAFVEFCSIH